MKKYLFITHVGDPGGAEYKMLRLIEPIKSNSEVMLFQKGELEDVLKEKGIKYFTYTMPKQIQKFKKGNGLFSIIKIIPAIISMIRNVAKTGRKFDVIICMSQKSFIMASLAKPFTRKPIIWFMNDILSNENFSRILILLLINISKYSANNIILNSQASFDAWVNSGGSPENVTIRYPGVDVQEFDTQILDTNQIQNYRNKFTSDNKPLIGIFGRISSWKGQEVFLRAISEIKNVRAVIVGGALFGEEKYENYLKELAIELGVSDRVTFAGHISDVAKAMSACDVITHCSTSPEPFGQVIVEAMLARVPVIASDAGGAKEIVIHNETGQLTEMGNYIELAKAIQKYIDDLDWTKLIVDKARKRAECEFSSQSMIDVFLKII